LYPSSATASSQRDDDDADVRVVRVSVVVDAHGFAPALRRRVTVVVADGDGDEDADTDTLLASLQPHPSANPAPPPWRLFAGTAGLFMASALALPLAAAISRRGGSSRWEWRDRDQPWTEVTSVGLAFVQVARLERLATNGL
jgi:hypothetical protein